jgi:hypothetical protein
MTPTAPTQDLATQWKSARRLYPVYFELAREFSIEVETCPELEAGGDSPAKEVIENAQQWLARMDGLIQVHQLRQFLQTSALVNQEGLITLLQHFLSQQTKTEIIRDKIDFLLVQYFSQIAPTGVADAEVDLAYVAHALESIVGPVELKPPVWLNSLDRVLESARRCVSLNDLLHGGVLEQGRKAKSLAGDLFYMPVALTAFTRFGYLMRRVFFRLMLGDLNSILDGLTELEEKGIATIDCRRAQFSAQEPIIRLRMICQSWKVMFQAEYSSGSPLRMLVDLRASVDHALGRAVPEPESPDKPAVKSVAAAKPAGKPAATAKPAAKTTPATSAKPVKSKASAAAASSAVSKPANPQASPKLATNPEPAPPADTPEFEVSGSTNWDPDSTTPPAKKK